MTFDAELKKILMDQAQCEDSLAETIAQKWHAAGLKLRDLYSATDDDINDTTLQLAVVDKVRYAVIRRRQVAKLCKAKKKKYKVCPT